VPIVSVSVWLAVIEVIPRGQPTHVTLNVLSLTVTPSAVGLVLAAIVILTDWASNVSLDLSAAPPLSTIVTQETGIVTVPVVVVAAVNTCLQLTVTLAVPPARNGMVYVHPE
jgi:hypothetical protein